jgi:two-component system CheB/CheR fusion protein
MACIVIQSRDSHQPGLLPALLSCVTKMPVYEGHDGMRVLPDQVYVIPPNADPMLEHGCLKFRPRTAHREQHLTVNTLFCSLAREYGQHAIGILLSGTHSDGMVGLQTIKTMGGKTFVQSIPADRCAQVPQRALVAWSADYALPPEEIARELAHLRDHTPLTFSSQETSTGALCAEEQLLTRILLILGRRTGVDFLSYKPATLRRRIRHRMAAVHLECLADYADYLDTHQDEVEALYQNVLIHVTDFFRDPPVFDALCRLVFPEMVERHVSGEAIRIWVPGCSTGEEAYSLAIRLIEFLEEHSLALPIQIFATDINPQALAQARSGVYAENSLTAVSPERLERFFTPLDRAQGGYRIAKEVRKRCIFARHNMVKDPPFSHLDLVSCRNVLIYLGKPLQQKAIQTFHYALASHGFLLLGTSESVAPLSQLFTRIERLQKLYKKRVAVSSLLIYPVMDGGREARKFPNEGEFLMSEETSNGFNLQQEADRLLLTNYAPASVVVDATMDILHVRGRTGPYLELAPGKASVNLLKMARPGLTSCLRAILHTALKENRTVIKESVQMNDGNTIREVRIIVRPINGSANELYFLVLFEETPASSAYPAASFHHDPVRNMRKQGTAARRVMTLEQELAATQAEMQAMLEERDGVNEELQAANEETLASNEELQSVNEELQSINEELETSKEELQAVNQELVTANQELEARNEQLREAQEYAEAIVEAMREALLILDADLRIQRANTAFYLLFRGTPPEVEGQYFFELGDSQWDIPQLRTLLEKVLVANQSFFDFRVEACFPIIGHRVMLLNGRRIWRAGRQAQKQLILLAIEDITDSEEKKVESKL